LFYFVFQHLTWLLSLYYIMESIMLSIHMYRTTSNNSCGN